LRQRKCKTKLPRTPQTEGLFVMVQKAEAWLRANTYTTRIYKWDTEKWGEIPADFGRK
jgi:ribonuclease HI